MRDNKRSKSDDKTHLDIEVLLTDTPDAVLASLTKQFYRKLSDEGKRQFITVCIDEGSATDPAD